MWMENEEEQLTEWLQKQDENYYKYKLNYEDTSPFFKMKKDEVKTDSLILKNKTHIGNHYFYETQDCIFYQHDEEIGQPTLFLISDSLQFKPKLIQTNFSNYLIVKGSRFLNDEVKLQVWDVKNKNKIAEFVAYNYPKPQATAQHLYFFESAKDGSTQLQKFNFKRKTTDVLDLESKYSLQVINAKSLITKLENKYFVYQDQIEIEEPQTIDFDNKVVFIGAKNTTLYFYDNQNEYTSFYSYDLKNDKVNEVFKMKKKMSLEKAILQHDFIYFSFIEKGRNNLFSLNIQSKLCKAIFENELASINFYEHTENSIAIDYTTFNLPQVSYELKTDHKLEETSASLKPELSKFKIEQKWIQNETDSIPIIFYYKDSLAKANAPLLVEVYGGFNSSVMPAYSSHINTFVKNGGIYAIAGVRGGGENGIEWHQSAILENKKNSFTDFEKCLDFISQEEISNPQQIAIYGFSNGGLIVNDAIINYSEKFDVAVNMFGLSDMLNFHKYNQPKWYNEFGHPKNRSIKKYLATYSPLHHLKKLPNNELDLLFITGDKDDRVSPFNSYKFVHGLQEYKNEAYLRVFKNVGHHFQGEKLEQLYNESFAFIYYNLEM